MKWKIILVALTVAVIIVTLVYLLIYMYCVDVYVPPPCPTKVGLISNENESYWNLEVKIIPSDFSKHELYEDNVYYFVDYIDKNGEYHIFKDSIKSIRSNSTFQDNITWYDVDNDHYLSVGDYFTIKKSWIESLNVNDSLCFELRSYDGDNYDILYSTTVG